MAKGINAMFKTVSADEWADFCSDYRAVGREPDAATLECVAVETDEVIGRVTYISGMRIYEIAENVKAAKIDYAERFRTRSRT